MCSSIEDIKWMSVCTVVPRCIILLRGGMVSSWEVETVWFHMSTWIAIDIFVSRLVNVLLPLCLSACLDGKLFVDLFFIIFLFLFSSLSGALTVAGARPAALRFWNPSWVRVGPVWLLSLGILVESGWGRFDSWVWESSWIRVRPVWLLSLGQEKVARVCEVVSPCTWVFLCVLWQIQIYFSVALVSEYVVRMWGFVVGANHRSYSSIIILKTKPSCSI